MQCKNHILGRGTFPYGCLGSKIPCELSHVSRSLVFTSHANKHSKENSHLDTMHVKHKHQFFFLFLFLHLIVCLLCIYHFFHVTQECLCVHTCACIMFVLLVKTRPVVVFCTFSLAAYLYWQRYFAERRIQNIE